MILYLDTSALVPLLIQEPTSAACGRLWDAADDVATVRIAYAEAAAALAMATRRGRIDERHRSAALGVLDELFGAMNIVEMDQHLMHSAATAAAEHGLRGYDSIHFAAAGLLVADNLVAASGDRQLLEAWRNVGVAVVDPREIADSTPA